MTEPLVAGVDTDCDQRKLDWRSPTEHVEDVQQRPAVLASGQADHHPVAVLDQRVLGDRFGDFFGQPRFERRFIGHAASSAVLPAKAGSYELRTQNL